MRNGSPEVEFGFSALGRAINIPIFVVGISVLIVGGIFMIWATQQVSIGERTSQQADGFIYIFPFPFAFTFNSPESAIMIPLIFVIVALPFILIVLMFRNFAKVF